MELINKFNKIEGYKSIYKTQLYFYTLAVNNQNKIKDNSIDNDIKKNNILRNTFNLYTEN